MEGRNRLGAVSTWLRPSAMLAFAMVLASAASGLVAVLAQRETFLAFYGYVGGWFVYSLLGALLAVLRPRSPIGWLFTTMGLSSELGVAAESVGSVVELEPGGPVERLLALFGGLWFVAFELVAALLILFPTGRPPSSRWRIALVLIGLNAVFGTLTSASRPEDSAIGPALVAALGPENGAVLGGELQGVASLTMFAFFVAGAVAIVRRARRSSGMERQQLKWITFAGVLVVVTNAGATAAFFSPLRAFDPDAPFPAAIFGGIPVVSSLVAVPAAAAIAILRYRLYDIDLLIKRTFVYGATSGAIAATFVAGILALQALSRPLTSGSELAVAASTLVSFALFQPIRRRVQDAVDRRFDRSRYDAARTLDAFADDLRDEVDLDALRSDLLSTVRRTMGPAHASLWLRERAR